MSRASTCLLVEECHLGSSVMPDCLKCIAVCFSAKCSNKKLNQTRGTAVPLTKICGASRLGKRYVFAETEHNFKCSEKGMKSLSAYSNGSFSSIQNVAIIMSAVFLIVIPICLSFR